MFGYGQEPTWNRGQRAGKINCGQRALSARLQSLGLAHRKLLQIYEQGNMVMEAMCQTDDIRAACHTVWGQQERQEGQRLTSTMG